MLEYIESAKKTVKKSVNCLPEIRSLLAEQPNSISSIFGKKSGKGTPDVRVGLFVQT